MRILKNFVFQSTHPHGVRPSMLQGVQSGQDCFNPRTHTGCDDSAGAVCKEGSSFNPRTHTGCDDTKMLRQQKKRQFQSTHPHGVRLIVSDRERMERMFQSTHPHGVRHIKAGVSGALYKFQSTHPHGVRRHTRGQRRRDCCFNPRTHTGCDLWSAHCQTFLACFNPHAVLGRRPRRLPRCYRRPHNHRRLPSARPLTTNITTKVPVPNVVVWNMWTKQV